MNSLSVIYTRFSIFNKNILASWRLSRTEDIDAAKAELLDHERLETRCNIFFNYTLPSIDKAVKRGYSIRHIVLYYSELPLWVIEKFYIAKNKYPWLKPIAVGYDDEVPEYPEIRNVTNEAAQMSSVDLLPVAGIRLDDDDMLGPNFFKQLELYLKPEFKGFCISFPSGVVALWEQDFVKFSLYYQEKVTMGLSQISLYDVKKLSFTNPYLMPPGNHMRVDEKVPTILDSRNGPLYLRTLHSNNDGLHGRSDESKSSYLQRLFKEAIDFCPLEGL